VADETGSHDDASLVNAVRHALRASDVLKLEGASSFICVSSESEPTLFIVDGKFDLLVLARELLLKLKAAG